MEKREVRILMVDSSFRESFGAEKDLIDFLTDFLPTKYGVELTLVFCDNYNAGVVELGRSGLGRSGYDLVIVEPNFMSGDFTSRTTTLDPLTIGKKFLGILKSVYPEMPVVVFTTSMELETYCRERNYAYVGKPVPLEKLGQVVAEKLGLRRSDEVILEELIIRR